MAAATVTGSATAGHGSCPGLVCHFEGDGPAAATAGDCSCGGLVSCFEDAAPVAPVTDSVTVGDGSCRGWGWVSRFEDDAPVSPVMGSVTAGDGSCRGWVSRFEDDAPASPGAWTADRELPLAAASEGSPVWALADALKESAGVETCGEG